MDHHISSFEEISKDILDEIDNWSFFNANEKIKTIEQSEFFLELNLNQKIIFFYLKVSYFFPNLTEMPENLETDLVKLEKLAKDSLEDNFLIKFYLFTIRIYIKDLLSERLTDDEIKNISSFLGNIQTIIENMDLITQRMLIIFYRAIGTHFRFSDEIDTALKYYELGLSNAKNLDVDSLVYFMYRQKQDLFLSLNDIDNAVSVINEAISYFEKNQNYFFYGRNLIFLGYYMASHGGDLKEAINYTNIALDSYKKLSNSSQKNILALYYVYLNRGILFFYMGNYNDSIKANEKSFEYALLLTRDFNYFSISTILTNLGELYYELGEYEIALDYQKSAVNYDLKRKRESMSDFSYSSRYYNLALNYINLGKIPEAEDCKDKILETLSKPNVREYKQIEPKLMLIQALILIKERSFASYSQAQRLLQKVVLSSAIKEDLIQALSQLIDLTTQEFKLTNNIKIFKKLEEYIVIFNNIATNYYSIPLKIQALLMKGKMFFVQGNIKDFESSFKSALKLADGFELNFFKKKINNALEEYRIEISRYTDLLHQKGSLWSYFQK